MKNLADIAMFLEDVLGHEAAQVFDENLEEFVYYVRSEALSNHAVTSKAMKTRIRRLAENIIAASVKKYLSEKFADANGEVELHINESGVYDKNMRPIPAVDKIRKTQKEMTSLMVQRGMYEFAKGRHLARIMDARLGDDMHDRDQASKSLTWDRHQDPRRPILELLEIQAMHLEGKLPNINPEEGKKLAQLYQDIRTARSHLE